MKHRSVIAFMLIAAALFAAPQISQDLVAFKSAVGMRLRGELLHAFLSLPSADGGADTAAPRRTDVLLATCIRNKSVEPSAKASRSESRASAAPHVEARSAESTHEQLAAVVNPSAVTEAWRSELSRGPVESVTGKAAEVPRRVPTDAGEVSMIIPPGAGIDPQAFADARAFLDARALESTVRGDALPKRKAAEELRRVSFVATRFDVKNIEWRKAGDDVLQRLNEALPGAYEFRLNRDGSKVRVLKVRRSGNTNRPAAPPRAPLAPGQVAVFAPVPAVNAQPLPACE
jgi:hypothetical protein